MKNGAPERLHVMLGSYPKTRALKSGTIGVKNVQLDFAPIDDAVKGFKGAVRDLKYDVAELALSTFLQARSIGKPYVLLPFVMNGKFHHASLLRRADNPFNAGDLNGRRVAMRSYSQTTPTWVRGFLMDDFGVKVEQVKWTVQGGGHVEECADPPFVEKMDAAKDLFQAMFDGDVDAILFGGKRDEDPRVATVLPDPAAAAKDWSRRYHAIPINHMVAVREELARDQPELIRNIYLALVASRVEGDGAQINEGLDPQPYGFENVRPALEIGVRYAVEQGLIPKAIPINELYGPVRKALADADVTKR